jgi:hypothetical protein
LTQPQGLRLTRCSNRGYSSTRNKCKSTCCLLFSFFDR